MSKQFDKYMEVLKSDTITERDILNLKKILNGWSTTSVTDDEKKQLTDRIWANYDMDGQKLTAEQNAKGITWLRDQWKTPRGIERKNNPFGYREEEVIADFSHFTFSYFYDDARVYDKVHHNYLPTYTVVAKSGATFEYYMARGTGYNGGSVSIIG